MEQELHKCYYYSQKPKSLQRGRRIDEDELAHALLFQNLVDSIVLQSA